MKLYKLSQDVNNEYDTFDACIVAATDEDTARLIQPSEYGMGWVPPASVKVELIGTAIKGTKPGVILASFNAG